MLIFLDPINKGLLGIATPSGKALLDETKVGMRGLSD